MNCPFCGCEDTRVIDSRIANEGDQVRRRRECSSCKERFSTYEYAVFNMPPVVKSGGEKQAFNVHKLRSGLMRAAQKRPVDAKSIDRAVIAVQKRVLKSEVDKVTSSLIGEYVMDELRQLDDVAYIRFASVYRHFKDLNEFREEIDKLATEEREMI